MEESQLRQVILGKLRDQTLPRDVSFNTITRAGEIVIRDARGEPCSICAHSIGFSAPNKTAAQAGERAGWLPDLGSSRRTA